MASDGEIHDGGELNTADLLATRIELIMGLVGVVIMLAAALTASPARPGLSTILFGIGTSLTATAAATYIVSRGASRLRGSLKGVAAVYKRRASVHEDVFRSRVEKAQRRILVQGCGLHRFLLGNHSALLQAAARGVDVRLLVLSGESTICMGQSRLSPLQLRDAEEHRDYTLTTPAAGAIVPHAAIRSLIQSCTGVNMPRGPIRARQFVSTSNLMLFVIDDVAYVGPYLHLTDSGEAPTMLLRRGPLLSRFVAHFENLWADDRVASDIPVKAEADQK